MIIAFGLTGNERKKLAWTVAMIIGTTAVYQFMPTCAYKIGECYTVTKAGEVIWKSAIKPTIRKQNGFLPNWQAEAMLFRTHQNRNPRA